MAQKIGVIGRLELPFLGLIDCSSLQADFFNGYVSTI